MELAIQLTGQEQIVKNFLNTLARFDGIICGSAALATFAMNKGELPFVPNDVDFIVPVDGKPFMHHIMYEFQAVFKVCTHMKSL